MPDLLLRIIVGIVGIIDAFLSYIVVGGNLTDSKGIDITDAVASIIESLTEFAAQFTLVFVNGTAG